MRQRGRPVASDVVQERLDRARHVFRVGREQGADAGVIGDAPVGGGPAGGDEHEVGPFVPAVDEHRPRAGRPTGGDDPVLAEEIVVRLERLDVGVDPLERERRVGDDLLEIPHQLGFGHHRKRRQVRFGEPLDVDAGESLGMEGGPFGRPGEQLPQPPLPLGGQAFGGPPQPADGGIKRGEELRLLATEQIRVDVRKHHSSPSLLVGRTGTRLPRVTTTFFPGRLGGVLASLPVSDQRASGGCGESEDQ